MQPLSFLAHEKLKKVISKCKADAATISELKSSITDLEDESQTQREKFEKSNEAQKLAAVKVMELEQRLATSQEEAENAKSELEKAQQKLSEAQRINKENSKRRKDADKDKKHSDSQVKHLQAVRIFLSSSL